MLFQVQSKKTREGRKKKGGEGGKTKLKKKEVEKRKRENLQEKKQGLDWLVVKGPQQANGEMGGVKVFEPSTTSAHPRIREPGKIIVNGHQGM